MTPSDFDPLEMTELQFGLPGRIYRSPMPFGMDPDTGSIFNEYIELNVQVVVNLLSRKESLQKAGVDLEEIYQQAGIQVIGLPIQDFNVPDENLLSPALDQAVSAARDGKNLVVHCYAGIGRTGTFLSCMAVKILGLSGEEAIAWIRKFIPHAVENEKQMAFIMRFGEKYADHQC